MYFFYPIGPRLEHNTSSASNRGNDKSECPCKSVYTFSISGWPKHRSRDLESRLDLESNLEFKSTSNLE